MTDGRDRVGHSSIRLVDFLREIPLLASLDEDLRTEIAATVEVIRVPAGAHIFHRGDPGDALYAVWSGRLEVLGPPNGPPLSVLGRGAAVGELALLTGERRTASVRAVRDSELVALDRRRFDELLQHPGFAMALTTILGRRLAGTVTSTRVPTERRNVVAVVALSPDVGLQNHVDRLVDTIRTWARVATLTERDVTSVDDHERGRTLDHYERDNEVVVLSVATTASSSWRDFCVRQADRILGIIDARDPCPGRTEEQLQGCDVAFWGEAPPSAARSAGWLDALQPRARHWISSRQTTTRDVQRIARRMFGRSIGVVLSGGGARGFAHIGVVAALQEAGLHIDRYGGTSMGAFVSALFASGRSWQEVRDVLEREVARRRPFADYTLPRHSLIRGRRARRMFQRIFGETRTEELPLDWFGISADLLTAETLVHRRGLIRHAVAASMSLPGIAPPVPSEGRLLVDGGVLNNLPVDVMAATNEGPVVAVEVMRRWREKWEDRVAQAPARSGRFLRRTRREVPIPSIAETIACATGLGASRSAEASRGLAWMTVTPDLADLGLLQWRRLDEAIAEGRRATQTALEQATPSAW